MRFEKFSDRKAVIRNARKLKGTGIFINEDLCPASQEVKKSKIPLLKQARHTGKIAFFRYTQLIIKERTGLPAATGTSGTGGDVAATSPAAAAALGVGGGSSTSVSAAMVAGVGGGTVTAGRPTTPVASSDPVGTGSMAESHVPAGAMALSPTGDDVIAAFPGVAGSTDGTPSAHTGSNNVPRCGGGARGETPAASPATRAAATGSTRGASKTLRNRKK